MIPSCPPDRLSADRENVLLHLTLPYSPTYSRFTGGHEEATERVSNELAVESAIHRNRATRVLAA